MELEGVSVWRKIFSYKIYLIHRRESSGLKREGNLETNPAVNLKLCGQYEYCFLYSPVECGRIAYCTDWQCRCMAS